MNNIIKGMLAGCGCGFAAAFVIGFFIFGIGINVADTIFPWFMAIGTGIGAIVGWYGDVSANKEAQELKQIEEQEKARQTRENYYAEKIGNTQIYKILIEEDRKKIMDEIKSNVNQHGYRSIEGMQLRSGIYVGSLNQRLSSMEFRDMNKEEIKGLVMAIGQTLGYRLIKKEYGNKLNKEYEYEFALDERYWEKIIEKEVQYNQSRKKDIF